MAAMGFRAAMADMAETIRRVFQAPAAHGVPLAFQLRPAGAAALLEARVLEPAYRFDPAAHGEPVLGSTAAIQAPVTFLAVLREEGGMDTWATAAKLCQLPLFQAEKCNRLAVPGLPRKAVVRRETAAGFQARTRQGWTPLVAPGTRQTSPELQRPRSFRALEQVLALPLAVTAEDTSKISRALWMRYTLQLVRSTGQNIRNLEVLGLYLIPTKGTRQIRHDPATGRLLVTLGPEAAGVRKAPFILAKQKDDGSVVCCFVEEA
jgi:hypothetical protein